SVFTIILPLAEGSATDELVSTIAIPSNGGKELSVVKNERSVDGSVIAAEEGSIALQQTMLEAFNIKKTSSYRPKILAVDDNPVNLQVLTNILSEDQYEVEVVTSGKEALGKLEWMKWDLIISDVMMPNMSGYDLTRSIREKYSKSELPVLLLTARSNL